MLILAIVLVDENTSYVFIFWSFVYFQISQQFMHIFCKVHLLKLVSAND